MHVLPNRSLTYSTFRQFAPYPLPNPVRRMPLFSRRFLVCFQNPIHELHCRRYFPARPVRLLASFRDRTPHRLTHHAAMNLQLSGDSGDRPDAELILPADPFKQFHLIAPIQRATPSLALARSRVIVRSEGGPNYTAELGHFKIPKSTSFPESIMMSKM